MTQEKHNIVRDTTTDGIFKCKNNFRTISFENSIMEQNKLYKMHVPTYLYYYSY